MIDRILLWGALVLLIMGASAYTVSALQSEPVEVQSANYTLQPAEYELQGSDYQVQGSQYKVQ